MSRARALSLEVSAHGRSMARIDPLLPQYPSKPLLGVFRKSHLIAFLQLLKSGTAYWPDSTDRLVAPTGERLQQLQDVLEHGIEMEVWPFAAVRDRNQAFLILMTTGNFDAAFALAEDEFG
eukprot:10905186-Alexandrium_andersonii.AAC.1